MKRKSLGLSADYRDIYKFNVKLIVCYKTNSGESVKKEAIVEINTTDIQKATELAIDKAKKQLEEFDYIIKSSILIEKKRRSKKQ